MNTGLHMVEKIRVDANSKWVYRGEKSGCVQPKKYDGKVDFAKNLSRFEHIASFENKTEIYSAIIHSISLKMRGAYSDDKITSAKRLTRAILFSTDTSLNALTLLSYYKARFKIEFLFRYAKQHTCLTHCQSRHSQAINNQVNASLTTLNLLKIEDQIKRNR